MSESSDERTPNVVDPNFWNTDPLQILMDAFIWFITRMLEAFSLTIEVFLKREFGFNTVHPLNIAFAAAAFYWTSLIATAFVVNTHLGMTDLDYFVLRVFEVAVFFMGLYHSFRQFRRDFRGKGRVLHMNYPGRSRAFWWRLPLMKKGILDVHGNHIGGTPMWVVQTFVEPFFCFLAAGVIFLLNKPLGIVIALASLAYFAKGLLFMLRDTWRQLLAISNALYSQNFSSLSQGEPRDESRVVIYAPTMKHLADEIATIEMRKTRKLKQVNIRAEPTQQPSLSPEFEALRTKPMKP